MTYEELKSICEEYFDAMRPVDIARELEVTPQVISNWKAKNQIPYNYAKLINKKVDRLKKDKNSIIGTSINIGDSPIIVQPSVNDLDDKLEFLKIVEKIHKIILKEWKVLFLITFAIIILSNLHSFYNIQDVFISYSKILPSKNESNTSKISGLANQFGLSLPSSSTSTDILSSNLYPELLKSRRLVDAVLRKPFITKKYKNENNLVSILLKNEGIDIDSSSALAKKIASDILLRNINVRMDDFSSLISLSVESFEPQLAMNISFSVIEELNNLHMSFKNSRLKQKSIFIEKRLIEVSQELSKAEDDLKVFREQNRKIQSSPALLLEMERNSREVQLQMQLYTTLKTESELVQIEEVENSRMVEIIDEPTYPFKASRPNRPLRMLLSVFLGFAIGFSFIVFKNFIKNIKLK
tara:strand:+ start:7485 stop:8717 length:1233 start_codon:yes stop_codon:yes gene_type:complete